MGRRVQSQRDYLAWMDETGRDHRPAAPTRKDDKREVIHRDDIKLIQPADSGLEYAVVAQWNPEHGSWDVIKSFDPPRKR
jgi:hypothetical protein